MINEPRYKPGDVLCDERYEILCVSWWNDGDIVYDIYDYSHDKRSIVTMRANDLNDIVDRYYSNLVGHYVKYKPGNRFGIVVAEEPDCYRVMYYAKEVDDFLITICQRRDIIDIYLGETTDTFKETLDRLKKENES